MNTDHEHYAEVALYPNCGYTGRGALADIIKKQYSTFEDIHSDWGGTLPQRFVDEFRRMSQEEFKHVRMMRGYGVEYGLHWYLPPEKPYTYIGLFRNPIERYITAFFHNNKRQTLTFEVPECRERFIAHAKANAEYQVYSLLGLWNHVGLSREQQLSMALNIIDLDYGVMGVTDLFEESVFLMKRRLNWKKSLYWTRTYKSPYKPKVEEVMEVFGQQLMEISVLERQLYDYIKQKISKQVEALSVDDQTAIEQLKIRNKMLQQVVTKVPLADAFIEDVIDTPSKSRIIIGQKYFLDVIVAFFSRIEEVFGFRPRVDKFYDIDQANLISLCYDVKKLDTSIATSLQSVESVVLAHPWEWLGFQFLKNLNVPYQHILPALIPNDTDAPSSGGLFLSERMDYNRLDEQLTS